MTFVSLPTWRKRSGVERRWKEEEQKKKLEYIKIKEWEEKFDREQKLREQEEIRREQRLIQKENEKKARFENPDNNTNNQVSGLEKFSVDKSKEN